MAEEKQTSEKQPSRLYSTLRAVAQKDANYGSTWSKPSISTLSNTTTLTELITKASDALTFHDVKLVRTGTRHDKMSRVVDNKNVKWEVSIPTMTFGPMDRDYTKQQFLQRVLQFNDTDEEVHVYVLQDEPLLFEVNFPATYTDLPKALSLLSPTELLEAAATSKTHVARLQLELSDVREKLQHYEDLQYVVKHQQTSLEQLRSLLGASQAELLQLKAEEEERNNNLDIGGL